MSSSRHAAANTPPSTPTVTACAPPTVPTKLCHIVKRPDFDGYGFNLHSEKVKPGQYIGKVDAHSPADLAGLCEGDRIIEVNGVPIGAETHRQVVQRIKALSGEVRLLLVDVAGGGATTTSNKAVSAADTATTIAAAVEPQADEGEAAPHGGTKREMPGASANISSISLVSTKRASNSSSRGSQGSGTPAATAGEPAEALRCDVTDGHVPLNGQTMSELQLQESATTITNKTRHSNNNNNVHLAAAATTTTPPPPSAATATFGSSNKNNSAITTTQTTTQMMSYNNSNGNNNNSHAQTTASAAAQERSVPPPSGSNNNKNSSGLQLSMTAAEMRAKLLSKKKYDPKNETVDLKKKFDIIQKL